MNNSCRVELPSLLLRRFFLVAVAHARTCERPAAAFQALFGDLFPVNFYVRCVLYCSMLDLQSYSQIAGRFSKMFLSKFIRL